MLQVSVRTLSTVSMPTLVEFSLAMQVLSVDHQPVLLGEVMVISSLMFMVMLIMIKELNKSLML